MWTLSGLIRFFSSVFSIALFEFTAFTAQTFQCRRLMIKNFDYLQWGTTKIRYLTLNLQKSAFKEWIFGDDSVKNKKLNLKVYMQLRNKVGGF